MTDIFG